jgi:acetylornithine deacetylase/succinyl-diaminopimelate desuccinylase-like protein
MLAAVLPDAAGRLPEELRAGRADPTSEERDGWLRLPGGATDIALLGGRPHDAGASADRYRRIGFEPSVDVHGIEVGDAQQVRTQIPATARAMLSMRLAPGQDSATMWPVLQRLLTAAAPDGADVRVTLNNACEPARAEPGHPVTRIGTAALERAAGVAPVLVPAGGSLPVLAGFAARGIPALLTGFGTLDSRVHAADESIRLDCLDLALRAARELYRGLATYRGPAAVGR